MVMIELAYNCFPSINVDTDELICSPIFSKTTSPKTQLKPEVANLYLHFYLYLGQQLSGCQSYAPAKAK